MLAVNAYPLATLAMNNSNFASTRHLPCAVFGRSATPAVLAALAALLAISCTTPPDPANNRGYHRIVVLSDTHLPSDNDQAKQLAIATINSWVDVDRVAVLGDVVATCGTPDQFAYAKTFLGKVSKPLRMIGGNHDYIYPDGYPRNPQTGRSLKEESPQARLVKLDRQKATWELPQLYYSERLGPYLQVYLTCDGLYTNNYTEMSFRQLQWFADELARNPTVPTIVFFHGPLKGTYSANRINPRTPDSGFAEPAGVIRAILEENPQVFLWVAGHLHIPTEAEDFAADMNLYAGRIWNIHNPSLTRPSNGHAIWTNSLFLYPDRVEVRTYDHKANVWLTQFDRTIAIPNLR